MTELDLPPAPDGPRWIHIRETSNLAAPMATVWARATTPDGINGELRPWIRMTTPAALRGKTLSDLEVGAVVGTSWLLALTVLPFDAHRLRVERVIETPDMVGFDERSSSWLQAAWHHHRRIEVADDRTCRVTDVVRARPRLPGAGWLTRGLVGHVFARRHRNLRALWGTQTC